MSAESDMSIIARAGGVCQSSGLDREIISQI